MQGKIWSRDYGAVHEQRIEEESTEANWACKKAQQKRAMP